MARKATLAMLAVVAMLLLQFADCMSAMTQDPQSMKCCGSMPCDPSNQSHDCCKTMVSSQTPSVLPPAHITLPAPVLYFGDLFDTPQPASFVPAWRSDFAAPQHFPPELYTLHASLLI